MSEQQFILNFTDKNAVYPEISGGKGASLAKLTAGSFNVPPGIIIASDAYRAFTGAFPGLEKIIKRLRYSDAKELNEQCSELRARLIRLPLPEKLDTLLDESLPGLLKKGNLAVRSSSTFEDLAGAAFAGQHDTYLNLNNLISVKECVARCFVSLWEDRAVRYRYEMGFDHMKAAMAVVIQGMVQAESAGVAFSMNPISGSLDQVMVNAAWGLGETVVSGEGDVDQFILKKKTCDLIESSIGNKVAMLVGNSDGIEELDVAAEKRKQPCLTQEQLKNICDVCCRAEKFYGFPQDIEWAVQGGNLCLLQSRPVTHFPENWTRDESAERFPNVVTPLTWDFVRAGFHESLEYSLKMLGFPPFHGKWFERFNCYIYGNQTAVKLFTRIPEIEFNDLEELRLKLGLFRERYSFVQMLPVTWARDLDTYLMNLGRYASLDFSKMSEQELWDIIDELNTVGRQYFLPNIAISILHGLLHKTLYRLVSMVAPAGEAPLLYDKLTSFCETKTNLVNLDFIELAGLIKKNPELTGLMRKRERRQLYESGKLEEFPEFSNTFKKFLENHGHREVDFDTYHPTWSGQPWVVLENIRLLLERDSIDTTGDREHELRIIQEEAERKFLNLLPDDLSYFSREILRLARVYTALDDLEHYQTTRLNVRFREAICELGRRFIEAGLAENDDDVFFLSKNTLEKLIKRQITIEEAGKELESNKDEYLKNKKNPPPWKLGEEAGQHESAKQLEGLPGSGGYAEAEVFIINGVEDFPQFKHGSVLVARTTNPAWTPLFYSAAAVITESGGPLSHGAVIAREIGIPAVMRVPGIMNILGNGQRVGINGSTGKITLID